MAKTRAPYADAFRQQMIDLVHAGRTPEDLAKEFEPTAQTIYNWVAQARPRRRKASRWPEHC
ncbi:transposase [Cupriavidus sp. DF5525]|uniref:transposase n=1 Tax=Cupriavidus sp. DF5525 TaxID=3160989 RepID=UPI00345FB742